MNTNNREKGLKELVLGKCWEYINRNFEKFSQPNKIKICLALLQKSMPTQLEGNLNQVVQMPTIQKGEKELVYSIGQAPAS